VMEYKGTTKKIPEIAAELGVANILEGGIQRSGNQVRINVQLIDAQTDEHLWAEIFDRELTADNLFAIQSEISEEIARALEATLSPEEQQRLNERPTENLAAYNAYLRGRQLLARRTSEDVDRAAREFERAVELDPQFALAWVGISEAAILQSQYSDMGKVEAMERQRMAAERALAIDDQLGEAHLGLASIAAYNERFDEAERAYRKALELSPGYATAWQWYGNLLAAFPSRLDDAVEKLQKALELDPLSSVIRKNLAERYVQLGQFDKANDQFDRLQQLDPDFAPVYASRAALAAEQGHLAERVRLLEKASAIDPGNISYYSDLLWAYLDLGYLEPVTDIRRQMTDINDQHPLLGMADMVMSIHQRNYDGALETARWAWERMGRPPFLLRIIGYINVARGEYTLARTAFEEADARLFDRARWREAIEQQASDACLVGLVLQRTGDPEFGEDLAVAALDYLENELPRYVAHTDRFIIEDCYLALERNDEALETVVTRMNHGHYAFWWLYTTNPHYQPLWAEPRFEAALQGVEEDIAAQRAELIANQTAAL
jgi:tetratricopeptide (TPR) repeat protein